MFVCTYCCKSVSSRMNILLLEMSIFSGKKIFLSLVSSQNRMPNVGKIISRFISLAFL